MDRSKNSSRKDGISHKIGDHKHQFRRKDLGGSNLLSRITANRGSLLRIIITISAFYFFWLGLFSTTGNSINSEKIFVFYSFRFMPAQLKRFGIDRNSAILSIAWRVILLSNFFLPLRFFFFFFFARLFCLVVVRSRN